MSLHIHRFPLAPIYDLTIRQCPYSTCSTQRDCDTQRSLGRQNWQIVKLCSTPRTITMHGHAAASQYGLQQPLPEVWGQQDEFRATPPPPYTERSGHSTMVEPSSLAQEQSSRSKRPRVLGVLLKLRIVPLFHITVSLKPWNIRNNMTSPNRVTV